MLFNDNNNNLKFKLTGNLNGNLTIQFYKEDFPSVPKKEYGFNDELNVYRNNIDSIDNEMWKKIRWYINKYDFAIKDKVINRAFYKYWEIIHEFNLFDEYNIKDDIILHCAEAPGGFIQGTNTFLKINKLKKQKMIKNQVEVDEEGFTLVKNNKKQNENYKIYTISLNKDLKKYKTYNLPCYNKIVINKYVKVISGIDNTGDINNLENLDDIYEKTNNQLFYLITADGGFDEECNFNNKEQLHYYLILNEIYSCIKLQKQNGHFILKMFDIFTDTSIHLLYLLSLCFKEVYIYKPLTSRPTNSEKYIICKYFNKDNRNCFLNVIKNVSLKLQEMKEDNKYVSFTLFEHISDDFINNINIINTHLLNRQIFYLKNAIELCNKNEFIKKYNDEYDDLINIRKQIYNKWELHYNLDKYTI